MNRSKYNLLKYFLFILFIGFSVSNVSAQGNDKEAQISNLVKSKNFVFEAQNVLSGRGIMNRNLSYGYDMQMLGDSVITYLPYFGRAYSASFDLGGGIKFTSTDFKYSVEEKNKGWNITIEPEDIRDVRRMFLTISKNGYATLQITSNNREPISFRGQILERKKKN